jgi:aldehyde dehydrogenase (NAD+)
MAPTPTPLPAAEPRLAGTGDEAVIEHARQVFALQGTARPRLAAEGPRERVRRLRRLRDALLRHRGELAAAVHADFRKHPAEFEVTELQVVLGEIGHAIRHLPRWMRPRRVPGTPLLLGTRSQIRFEPRGRVLILSPWNYPLQLAIVPLVGAMSAGNAVLLRPSEKAPATARAMRAMLAEAFPEDEVAMVTGGVPVAESLLELPFDHLFFTGSTAVGRRVMRAAAGHLASVTLELGGKSPAIVDRSADVGVAAERIVWGKLVNAGQSCVAPDYVLVPRELQAAFLDAARGVVSRLYGADAAAVRASADLPRIVDDGAFQRLEAALEATLAAGARLVVGGDADASTRYLAPTLLADVPPDSPLMREEIFGPILPVLPCDTLDEAIAFVARRPPPLSLYVFSRDRRATERVVAGTRAGGTLVNHTLCHLANPALPFGGVGESGQGSYHGFHGFRAFSHERAVLHAGRMGVAPLYYPPYGRRMRRIASAVTRWLARG